jgi:hypothetical protein
MEKKPKNTQAETKTGYRHCPPVMPAFVTLALADKETRDRRTNASRPSDNAVVEAKEWVDEHKL